MTLPDDIPTFHDPAFEGEIILHFEGLDNQALLNVWARFDKLEAAMRDVRQRVEFELKQRMEIAGATAIFHQTLTCELKKPSPAYDQGKLMGLAELVEPAVLKLGYTPEHEETVRVPAKWDARVFKSWAKYGGAVALIIESAAIPGAPQLRIGPKEITIKKL